MQEDNTPQTIADYIVDLGSGTSVITDGPLGAQCAQALTDIYGKSEQPQLVLESQVNDLSAMVGIWQALRINGGSSKELAERSAVVYSANARDVTAKDVARFRSIFAEMGEAQRLTSCLLLEVQGLNADQYSEYCQDLISSAMAAKVRVFTRLASYIDDLSYKGVAV